MATSVLKDMLPKLNHSRYLYSSSTATVVTNGSQTLRSGTFEKAMDGTTLIITFMCNGYVDSLSGGFYFYIDNESVASAVTTFSSTQNFIIGQSIVENVSAGTHNYSIIASTQGNNTLTIPAWTNNVFTLSEM